MFKQKSNKQIVSLKDKGTQSKQLKISNKMGCNQLVSQFRNMRRNPSISKKIEGKYIYNVNNLSRERSESLRTKNKIKADRPIYDEYRVNREKKIYKKQQPPINKQDDKCLELKCNSRQSYKDIDKVVQQPKTRLLRVRSNDSFSKYRSDKMKQQQNQKTLKSLKQANIFLKKTHAQSQTRINQLQQQKQYEKNKFQQQIVMYQQKIDSLRSKIDRNKVDIGHLFSYQSFDPFKVAVKPIIEVEQNSSIMRSLYNTNKKSENKKNQESQYGLFEKIKRNPTETTCIQSIQDYTNIQLF